MRLLARVRRLYGWRPRAFNSMGLTRGRQFLIFTFPSCRSFDRWLRSLSPLRWTSWSIRDQLQRLRSTTRLLKGTGTMSVNAVDIASSLPLLLLSLDHPLPSAPLPTPHHSSVHSSSFPRIRLLHSILRPSTPA
ncbi:hypothetical protein K523DRAFT_326015 [Schizophyllum commune Tattone D]|nr:hypothetical protein K523DRAFT_326015 [Schizophyllum commune Tattone D]